MSIDELVESMRLLAPWQRRVVVGACMQRVLQVLERLGNRDGVQLFRDYLDLLWQRVDAGLDNESAIVLDRRLEDVLDGLEDADDSDHADYYPEIAASLLVDAATTFRDTSYENAAFFLKGAVDLWAPLEADASDDEGQILILSPDASRNPGPLEKFECAESESVVAAVRHMPAPDPEVLRSVRRRAQTPSGPLEETLSSLIKKKGQQWQ